MYQVACHTCGVTTVFDGLESGQREFNSHAERHHQVELCRVAQSMTDGSEASMEYTTESDDARAEGNSGSRSVSE